MTGSKDWYDEEDDRTFDEQMMDAYGCMADWKADAEGDTDSYTDVYRNFLENGCRGILTYEQAVEAYKWSTGINPDRVTSWPEIDWVKRQREGCEKDGKDALDRMGLSLDEFNATRLPYGR